MNLINIVIYFKREKKNKERCHLFPPVVCFHTRYLETNPVLHIVTLGVICVVLIYSSCYFLGRQKVSQKQVLLRHVFPSVVHKGVFIFCYLGAVLLSISFIYFTFLWEKLFSFPYFICSITISNSLRQIILKWQL